MLITEQDTFSRVVASLKLLRRWGSTIPAEVFHFADEQPSEQVATELTELGASLRTVENQIKDPNRSKNVRIISLSLHFKQPTHSRNSGRSKLQLLSNLPTAKSCIWTLTTCLRRALNLYSLHRTTRGWVQCSGQIIGQYESQLVRPTLINGV